MLHEFYLLKFLGEQKENAKLSVTQFNLLSDCHWASLDLTESPPLVPRGFYTTTVHLQQTFCYFKGIIEMGSGSSFLWFSVISLVKVTVW